jgi:hypothetical protein
MLPFTTEQFFAVFASYNETVWPAPVFAYALGAVAVAAALHGGHATSRLVAAALALMWLWTGIAYHWLAFVAINDAAWAFGALFVAEAALLVRFGMLRGSLQFRYRSGRNCVVGLLFVVYAAILYPLVGQAFGHGYPAMPMFGITPCPVTIFTFGLLLLTRSGSWPVVAIPLLWSLIGGTAAFLLNVPQDWLLLFSGPVAAILLWRTREDASG